MEVWIHQEVKDLAQGCCLLTYCSWHCSLGQILHAASTEGADSSTSAATFSKGCNRTKMTRAPLHWSSAPANCVLILMYLQLNLTLLCRACGGKWGCWGGCLRAPGCRETMGQGTWQRSKASKAKLIYISWVTTTCLGNRAQWFKRGVANSKPSINTELLRWAAQELPEEIHTMQQC